MSVDIVIASLRIRLQPEEGAVITLGERFSSFINTDQGDPDVTLFVSRSNAEIPGEAEKVFEAQLFEESDDGIKGKGERFWEVSNDGERIFISIRTKNPDREPLLVINRDKKTWQVYTDSREGECDPLPYPVDGLFLYYLISCTGGIMIHGSAADHGGRGWLFTGKSGSGKTTIAKIFDNSGDRVIHDDRLIVMKSKAGWMIHSTPVYRNDEPRSVPLDHIWVVGHGRSNVSVPVSGAQAAALIMANCIQQNWDRELTMKLASSVEDIVTSVPVSNLQFVPDNTMRDYLLAHEDHSLKRGFNVAATLLSERKSISINAGGYSMWPSIHPGDKVIVEPPGAVFPGKGDIVALFRDGGFVVHRIIEEEMKEGERYYKTQGDSSMSADKWSSEDEIAGVVKEIIRSGKRQKVSSRKCPVLINRMSALIERLLIFIIP